MAEIWLDASAGFGNAFHTLIYSMSRCSTLLQTLRRQNAQLVVVKAEPETGMDIEVSSSRWPLALA